LRFLARAFENSRRGLSRAQIREKIGAAAKEYEQDTLINGESIVNPVSMKQMTIFFL